MAQTTKTLLVDSDGYLKAMYSFMYFRIIYLFNISSCFCTTLSAYITCYRISRSELWTSNQHCCTVAPLFIVSMLPLLLLLSSSSKSLYYLLYPIAYVWLGINTLHSLFIGKQLMILNNKAIKTPARLFKM